MKRLIAVAALAALTVPGCAEARTRLSGAGASFPSKIYQRWFADFAKSENHLLYILDGNDAPAPESRVRASAQPGTVRAASAATAISLFIWIRYRGTNMYSILPYLNLLVEVVEVALLSFQDMDQTPSIYQYLNLHHSVSRSSLFPHDSAYGIFQYALDLSLIHI